MHALVSGCCGFIGSQLSLRLLQDGYEVHGVDNLWYNNYAPLQLLSQFNTFTFSKMDVRSKDFLTLAKWSDFIIHLAAIVGARACDYNQKTAQETNADATIALAKSISKDQLLIYTNSNSAYGSSDQWCDEDSPMNPLSLYASSKMDGEKAVLDAAGVSLRLATVYGLSPRMRFDLMIPDFVSRLIHEGKISIFESHYQRNALAIKDCVRAIRFVMNRITGPNIYNVGDPALNLSKKEIALEIASILGLPNNWAYKQNPSLCVVTEGAGKDPDGRDCKVSYDKILAEGFSFTHTLEEGVQEIAQLCRCITRDDVKRLGNA